MAEVYEIYRLSCIAIHGKLKEKINASINVRVYDDKLTVVIRHGNDEPFLYEKSDWLDYCIAGKSKDSVIEEIYKTYRKYVLNRYFY